MSGGSLQDALDEGTKHRIEHLSAYHSLQYSVARRTGQFPKSKDGQMDVPYHGTAYLRPLVKTHPETKRKGLFVAAHCFGIPGLSGMRHPPCVRSSGRALSHNHNDAHILFACRSTYQEKKKERKERP